LTEFIDNARLGAPIPNDKVIEMAKLFRDDLTLANITRPQLLALCRYMNLQTYGTDSFLRFQLRTKLRNIKEDDRRILWEGVDSLNTIELREACRERGMVSMGMTQFKLKHQLQEWLELSTQKSIPISLLIMSRAFQLTTHHDDPEEVLKSSMSSLDSDTINEVVIAAAPANAEQTTEMRKRKLESLKFQQEVIAVCCFLSVWLLIQI
jgi:LETM1 and EF-hand domain-containing protein 1, mitochondrial